MDARAVPNANFTSLGGRSVHDRDDAAYREYRRQWEENPRTFTVGDFPIHLDLEASSRCNLRCTFCDKLPLLGPEHLGDMDFDLYRLMVDEGAEKGLKSLKLSYRGEPLLNRRLADMVAHAKRRGLLDVYFNTNAMLLTESTAKALIDAGLDRISVSVEGTDPVAFERERIGAKFEVIVRNLARLADLRARAGTTHPRIRVQTVRLPGLDFEEYARFWSPYADETASVDYKDVVDRKTGVHAPHFACPQLWQRMTVEFDGQILGCNNDDFRKLSPGRAGQTSLEQAWKHPLLENARALHRQGLSHRVEACDGCPWREAQMDKSKSEQPA
ncbi:radical SAM protein [Fundidesulfovibrio butyratiphilus]